MNNPKAKILLFNPPAPEGRRYTREGRCTQEAGIWGTQWPPVSLTTTAALLEKDGHMVRVVDFPAGNGDMETLKGLVIRDRPDFAFWTTGTPTINFDLGIARLIKHHIPKTVTGVMGTHVTIHPEHALGEACIDLVVRREPEATIREICRHYKKQRSSINGISFREGQNGRIVHNPDAGFLSPREIPVPAWHTLANCSYRLPLAGRPFLIVAPVRGCPYPCSFCTASIYYGKQLRKRPVDHVVDEMETDMERFGIQDFFIWADTFTLDNHYVSEFCTEIIRRGLNISWTCNSRVDTVDRKILMQMKEAGLWMISYGLESGNDDVLKATGKGISISQSVAAVSTAHELGIKTAGHFILGLPGETEKTMQQTLNLSLKLPLDIAQFYTAAPFPGTRLYEEALRYGWLRGDAVFSQGSAVLELPGLPAKKVNDFRRYSYRRFYLRPKTFQRVFAMLKTGSARQVFSNAFRFIEWVRK